MRLNYQKTNTILFGRRNYTSLRHHRIPFQRGYDRQASVFQRRCCLAEFGLQKLYHLAGPRVILSSGTGSPYSKQSYFQQPFMVWRSGSKVIHPPPLRELGNTTRLFATTQGTLGLSETSTCSKT